MIRTIVVAGLAGTLLTSCSRAPETAADKKVAEAEAKVAEASKALEAARKEAATQSADAGSTRPAAAAKTVILAAGTPLKIRTTSLLSTKNSSVGGKFAASLEAPLTVDGVLVAGKGAEVEGLITEADDGGRVKGRAEITVTLRRLTTADGRTIDIRTDSESRTAQSGVKKDAMKVGVASGIGAAIGAIAGGGKGAAIGAGVGAAGGTGVVLATKGDAAQIPAETVLTFKLTAPVTVTQAKR